MSNNKSDHSDKSDLSAVITNPNQRTHQATRTDIHTQDRRTRTEQLRNKEREDRITKRFRFGDPNISKIMTDLRNQKQKDNNNDGHTLDELADQYTAEQTTLNLLPDQPIIGDDIIKRFRECKSDKPTMSDVFGTSTPYLIPKDLPQLHVIYAILAQDVSLIKPDQSISIIKLYHDLTQTITEQTCGYFTQICDQLHVSTEQLIQLQLISTDQNTMQQLKYAPERKTADDDEDDDHMSTMNMSNKNVSNQLQRSDAIRELPAQSLRALSTIQITRHTLRILTKGARYTWPSYKTISKSFYSKQPYALDRLCQEINHIVKAIHALQITTCRAAVNVAPSHINLPRKFHTVPGQHELKSVMQKSRKQLQAGIDELQVTQTHHVIQLQIKEIQNNIASLSSQLALFYQSAFDDVSIDKLSEFIEIEYIQNEQSPIPYIQLLLVIHNKLQRAIAPLSVYQFNPEHQTLKEGTLHKIKLLKQQLRALRAPQFIHLCKTIRIELQERQDQLRVHNVNAKNNRPPRIVFSANNARQYTRAQRVQSNKPISRSMRARSATRAKTQQRRRYPSKRGKRRYNRSQPPQRRRQQRNQSRYARSRSRSNKSRRNQSNRSRSNSRYKNSRSNSRNRRGQRGQRRQRYRRRGRGRGFRSRSRSKSNRPNNRTRGNRTRGYRGRGRRGRRARRPRRF